MSAETPSLEVQVSPDPVIIGEPAQLKLSSNQDYPLIINQPEVEGIQWHSGISRGREESIINYKRKITATSSYSFTVTKEGNTVIPAMAVKIGDQTVKTQPILVKALSRQLTVKGESGNKTKTELSDLLFEKIILLSNKKEFYVGEEINLEVRIYVIQGLNVELSWPALESENVVFRDYGKINRENERFMPPRQSSEQIKDHVFNIYAFRTQFRPIADENVKIRAVERCTIRLPEDRQNKRRSSFFDDDFFFDFDPFGRRGKRVAHELAADLPEIKVIPLPSAPDDTTFLGLVGNWDVRYSVSSENLKTGEPVTLTLDIRGQGTLETLKAPELKIPGFRIYPPEVTKTPSGAGIVENAQIKYVMIPLQQGTRNINVSFCAFSTPHEEYRKFNFEKSFKVQKGETVSSGEQVCADYNGKAPAEETYEKKPEPKRPRGILYLKRNASGVVKLPLTDNYIILIVLLLICGPLIFAISEFLVYRRRKLTEDPDLRRKMTARSLKGAVLKSIKKASAEEIDDVVRKKAVPFINDMLSLPPGTSSEELAEKVNDSELADCLRNVGASSYMPGGGNMNKDELKNRIYRALKKLSVIAFLLILPFSMLSAEEEKNCKIENSEDALTAYDKGEFEQAADYYRKHIQGRRPDPAMLYNLGNCLTQLGDYSKAFVCYERAHRLNPSDTDILGNLNYVRRKLILPQLGRADSPWQLVMNLRDSLRPDQWLLAAAAIWFFAFIVISCFRIMKLRRCLSMLIFLSVCLLLCLGAALSQYAGKYNTDKAVIIGNNIPVYTLPFEKSSKAEFKLKDGDLVTIEEKRKDWVRVRADKAEGWIHSNQLASLWGADKLPF